MSEMGWIKPLPLPQCPLHYVSIKVSTLIKTYFAVPPGPLVLLSGQAFHLTYFINVVLTLFLPHVAKKKKYLCI